MDCREEWDFHSKFDLVHTRLMNGFSIPSWPEFYAEAFTHIQPGGWIENQEFDLQFYSDDNTLNPNGPLARWTALWNHGIEVFGDSARCYPDYMKQCMQNAGFINVHVRPFKCPIAPWPKDKRLRQAGAYFFTGFIEHISGLSAKVFTNALGWTIEQMEVLCMEVRQECRQRSMHAYFPVYVFTQSKGPALADLWR